VIPEFPNFKAIELSDKEEVEKFTKKFPPYSDFNFASMWSWDIKGEMRISQLNGNLIVRFNDYLTGEPFYSFLGNNMVNETAEALLELSKKEGLGLQLKLIPEEVIKGLDLERFDSNEDRDHFDYIYNVETFSKLESSKFNVRRRHTRFFSKTFLHDIKKHDEIDVSLKGQILNLYNDWANEKGEKITTEYSQHEFLALSRFISASEHMDFFVVGIYYENRLIAVALTENTPNQFNLSHFQKAVNSNFKGLNTYLVHEIAKMLEKENIKYINWEQDLGISGLRENKEAYLPCGFLKKYSLSTAK